MTFQPVIPISGYGGWLFLNRTMDSQKTAFVESPPVQRATSYFRDTIAKVRTPEDLVGDRRLLEVALGAFGLDEDIDNKAFLIRILGDGTLDQDALANKLSDKRYAEFSRAFGFGDLGARTALSGFADTILSRYESRQFERAVGEQDETMRLALNLSDALGDVIRTNATPTAQWFAVMGNPPLRKVFEGALGLPPSFGRLEIDRQLDVFRDRARATFGTDDLAAMTEPAVQEKVVRLFLIRSEAANTAAVGGASVALSLLQGITGR